MSQPKNDEPLEINDLTWPKNMFSTIRTPAGEYTIREFDYFDEDDDEESEDDEYAPEICPKCKEPVVNCARFTETEDRCFGGHLLVTGTYHLKCHPLAPKDFTPHVCQICKKPILANERIIKLPKHPLKPSTWHYDCVLELTKQEAVMLEEEVKTEEVENEDISKSDCVPEPDTQDDEVEDEPTKVSMDDCSELYIGTKIIRAMPMEKDGKPGYMVKYPDGYISWSPKEAFDNSHRKIFPNEFALMEKEMEDATQEKE